MPTLEQYQTAEREKTLHEWRRGWRIHALVYAGVNVGLVALNAVRNSSSNDSFWWFPFPMVGWGIGLARHYLRSVRWAEREIRRRQAEIEERAERLTAPGRAGRGETHRVLGDDGSLD